MFQSDGALPGWSRGAIRCVFRGMSIRIPGMPIISAVPGMAIAIPCDRLQVQIHWPASSCLLLELNLPVVAVQLTSETDRRARFSGPQGGYTPLWVYPSGSTNERHFNEDRNRIRAGLAHE